MNDDFYCPQCQNFTTSNICDICGSPTDQLNVFDSESNPVRSKEGTYPDELVKKVQDDDEEMEGMNITSDDELNTDD